nr:hypothetical protein [Tanacetum cinerariifolium]
MDESQSYLIDAEHRECYDRLIKSYNLDKSLFSTYDKVYSLKRNRKHKDKDEDPSTGSDRGLKKRKTRKDAEPTTGPKTNESKSRSSKGSKSQSKSSSKSIQSEEPEFKVADSNMPQDQEENLGNDDEEPKRKVASKRDWYGCLREIEVRRADNDLYMFKEGDFPRLRINDIEDMLILIVQNRLTNLSGDDVSEFAIALRMFTRSMAIQKRVEDLQLGVKSYQKKINITKPETKRHGLGKKDAYTQYQDPQRFIYFDTRGRNRLICSDELYKFSDGTLTRL